MNSFWMKKVKIHLKTIALGSLIMASAYGTYRFGKTVKNWIQRVEKKQMYEMEDYIQHKYIEAEKLYQRQHQK